MSLGVESCSTDMEPRTIYYTPGSVYELTETPNVLGAQANTRLPRAMTPQDYRNQMLGKLKGIDSFQKYISEREKIKKKHRRKEKSRLRAINRKQRQRAAKSTMIKKIPRSPRGALPPATPVRRPIGK